jgi:purine-binding chemotaxis protein CheW
VARENQAPIWERISRFLAEDGPAANRGSGSHDATELRTLWRRRARELSVPTSQEREGPLTEKLIILRVGRERYAFRVDDVEEIMRVPAVTPVPCVPPAYLGVVNRRGTILPLVDLKVFFGGERAPLTVDSRVVVLSRERLTLGLLAEAADKILGIPAERIGPPPRRGPGLQEDFCAGVLTLDRKVVVLIDSLKLLQDDRLRVDKGAS